MKPYYHDPSISRQRRAGGLNVSLSYHLGWSLRCRRSCSMCSLCRLYEGAVGLRSSYHLNPSCLPHLYPCTNPTTCLVPRADSLRKVLALVLTITVLPVCL